jgi:hypothetical protein
MRYFLLRVVSCLVSGGCGAVAGHVFGIVYIVRMYFPSLVVDGLGGAFAIGVVIGLPCGLAAHWLRANRAQECGLMVASFLTSFGFFVLANWYAAECARE